MTWNVNANDGTVSRDEALGDIQEMARDKGISGSFKVYYDGVIVASPSDLPERVNLALVSISETLDQA